ncbi:CheY chemotaxis protein or a CheY-like REC (receiver) domain [Methylobacterium phyllostachyos]|uniref:CheY chemotaxis protein or a CheY-like REC (Receiver) domain n=1 Tax=Methylobacterium phyllostachyos TaxID=582672 RepID=A0A1G9YXZ9_9HYPH|nr:response regulator [Methylobacterium phyllostachyos]SDN14079.1 CheY chemotaxis protein or a CheY-like REC (receiver) domain [Methylobacterium phyllostachyos]
MNLLEGRRVLLVEDESLVAMMAEDMLLDLGCEVIVAMRLDKAVDYVHAETFDLAVLDVNLGDALSYPVANLLRERCTPFLFATGYGARGLEETYRSVPVLQKPYQAALMAHLLNQLLAGGAPTWGGSGPEPATCACHRSTEAPSADGSFQADLAR